MKVWIFILVVVLASFNCACLGNLGSHAIDCMMAGEQKVCFVREVWGLNGDEVSLTTSDNVCHKPSEETDYVSNYLRGNDVILAKYTDGKLYVYAEYMDAPKKPFPVVVIAEEYDPARLGNDFTQEGYQKIDLSKENMTWCLNDIF